LEKLRDFFFFDNRFPVHTLLIKWQPLNINCYEKYLNGYTHLVTVT
jgi:hypothetical protein